MLKDDKTYPWICIKTKISRVFLTRTIIKDGSEYYGWDLKVRPAKFYWKQLKFV